jgi:glycosyltransferase involved in cell wall biosynthesis
MPAVSVVLLSYNQSEYLAQSVESVLNQTSSDWELLVIDNGSTDGSHAVLKRYESHPQVRLVLHADNLPCTKRLNEGVALAKGEYVSILYSDDYYLPNKIARQLTCFREGSSDLGVVYSPGYRLHQTTRDQWLDPFVDVSGEVLDAFLENLLNTAYVNPISPLVKRECFERYPFHEEIFIEGEGIYLRIAMRYRFKFDPEPVVVMRDHHANLGRSIKRNMEFLLFVLDRLEHHPDFPDRSRSRLHALKIRVIRTSGWQAVRVADDGDWARAMFRRSLSLDWKEAFHPKTIAGLGLSFLPSSLRRAVNGGVGALKRSPGHSNYVRVEDGGS